MRILALVPGGIGDQILFFPTLDDLKRTYPDSQIDVVVEPRATGAYRVSKSVQNVLTFDYKGNNSLADWGNLLGLIRDREYDIALSLGQRWSVGLLLWLTGVPTRIGYAGSAGQSFLTDAVPLKPNQYAANMYHDLLQGLKMSTPCPDLAINVPVKDLEWAEMEQKRLGLQGGGYVLIHGGSSALSQQRGLNKRYPVEGWVKIIQDFYQRQPELPVVVIQGPEDREVVKALLEAGLKPEPKVTAPADIGKLAALIAGSSLLLCTDSAPMHLGVAVQAFTLGLFGPTDPQKLLPVSDRFVGIQSPTGNLADLTPQTVLGRIWGA